MDQFSFKPISPGMRILWFLQFNPEESDAKHVDLYIPSPVNNEWHNASGLLKTLDNLNKIQKVCHDIKQETKAQPPQEAIFIKYIKKLKNLLKNISPFDDTKKEDKPTDKKDDETESN